jgi:hypothetical protein
VSAAIACLLCLLGCLAAGTAGAQSPEPRQSPEPAPAPPPPAPAGARPPARSAPPLDAPSVRELVRMVLRAARHIDADRVQLLVRRARLSGLMPTLRFSSRRGLRQDLSSSSSSEVERLAAAVADDLSFEASLTFELPRLVFAPEEVRLLSVERWLAGDLRRLLEEAIKLYFQRRKLMLERERAAAPDADLEIAIAEQEALLDALTGGAFTKQLARPSR